MREYVLFMLLLISLMAKEVISIENFEWYSSDKIFSFSGKTTAEDGLKLKVNLILNKQIGATCFIVTKNNYWEGYFTFPDKMLLPGDYFLEITIPYQRVAKHQTIWSNHKNIVFEKKLSLHPEKQPASWQKLRDQLLETVQHHRFFFDKAVVQGHLFLWKLQESKDGQVKQNLQNDWLAIKNTLPNYKEQQKTLRKISIDSLIINPYADIVLKIESWYGLLQQVQVSMHENIMDVQSYSILPFFVLIQNIQNQVRAIFAALGSDHLWEYKIDVENETGRFKDHNYSSYHGFYFSVRNAPENMIPGEKSSPLRLTLKYKNFNIKIFRIDCSENFEKKQKLWQLMALCEWSLIEKTGEYISIKKPNSNKKRKVYTVEYNTSKNNERATGVLYFSSDSVYCILSEYKDDDVFALDNIMKITETFNF